MNDFICLTFSGGGSCFININNIVAYYPRCDGNENATVIETSSTFKDGRFLVTESVSQISDMIKTDERGGDTDA